MSRSKLGEKGEEVILLEDNYKSHKGRRIKDDQTPIFTRDCPCCGHQIKYHAQVGIHKLPGLPAGVKFDPTDQELLQHLEGKVIMMTQSQSPKLHPLIDQFIPTIEGDNGICYTHPHKLPGVSKDGVVRHFFHRPSKAYTTGTRKRRKVHTETTEEGGETRWHKTGKTRPVFVNGRVQGYKKILVLYTNYGKQRKAEKTNWVMHQYHLGVSEDEKHGQLVVSKVFYQTQPRQCANSSQIKLQNPNNHSLSHLSNANCISFAIENEATTTTSHNMSQHFPDYFIS